MASPEDLATVRANTATTNTAPYTDTVVGDMIDAEGVLGASATIWTQKAAEVAHLVDVAEAGASHKFSDLHKNALALAADYRKQADAAVAPVDTTGQVRVRRIVRS